MPWIALTDDHIKARLAYDELIAIESTGGEDGAACRLEGIIVQVTALIRAKVAGCHKNTLGTAGTIPEECLHAAATIAKHDIRASLPSHGGEDEGGLRKEEYREAMNFLNSVSKCEIGITDEGGAVDGQDSGCYGGDDKHDF